MKEEDNFNKNKEIFLKIREYNSNNKLTAKKKIKFSTLFDYDTINKLVTDSIKKQFEKLDIKNVENLNLLFLINHPQIKEIYIYSEEQWNFYLNYNLIFECIENNTIKIEYYLITNENNRKNIKEEFKINKKNVIKHIIKNISLSFFLKTFLKFFDENKEFAKKFRNFFINELFNNQSENKILINNNAEENIEDNININNLISSQNFLIEENKSSQINEKILRDYYVHKNELFQLFEKQFKNYCKYQESFVEIKDLFENDEKQIDIDKNKINKTNLDFSKNKDAFGKISIFESIVNNSNDGNALLTQLNINDSKKYVKELMNDNIFKRIEENEYYKGFECFKDELNREIYGCIKKKK